MKRPLLFAALSLFFLFQSISAQSTIFNAPSTDVQEKGKTYLEFDFISHFDKYENGGFQTYGWRGTYGIGKKVEVGANLFYTSDGGKKIPFVMNPNAKWQTYANEKKKIAVSTGIIASVPLNRAAGTRTTAMVYSNISKVISKANGLRTTFGGYKFINTKKEVGDSAGIFVGIEQPLFKRVSFTGDWFSGKNGIGYATPGLTVLIKKNQIFGAGYNIGNSGRGNNSFTSYYGVTF